MNVASRNDSELREFNLTYRRALFDQRKPWLRSIRANRGSRQKLLAIGNQKIEHSLRRGKQHFVFSPHNEPLSHNRKTGDIEGDQSSIFEFDGHRVRRNEGDPEFSDNGLLDGFVATHFHGDRRLKPGRFKKLLHETPRAGALLAGDEGFMCQSTVANLDLLASRCPLGAMKTCG